MRCKNGNHSCNSCGEKKCGNKHTTCHNADVAKEIFAELQQEIKLALDSNYKARMEHLNKYPDTDNELLSMLSGKISTLRGIDDFIDELKKKYESEGEG